MRVDGGLAPLADFCVVGFPRCGTSATIHMLRRSAALNVHVAPNTTEFPYYVRHKHLERPEIDPARPNGHKHSSYLYHPDALKEIKAENPRALLIVNVRPAGEALLSWRDMHRERALAGAPGHFTTETPQARQFYSTCSEAEYFAKRAKPLLNYADRIRACLKLWPTANMVIVTQARLSRDAAGVMRSIHDRLGIGTPEDFYSSLPVDHQPRGNRDLAARVHDGDILRQLSDYDAALLQLMSDLQPSQVLRADPDGF